MPLRKQGLPHAFEKSIGGRGSFCSEAVPCGIGEAFDHAGPAIFLSMRTRLLCTPGPTRTETSNPVRVVPVSYGTPAHREVSGTKGDSFASEEPSCAHKNRAISDSDTSTGDFR